MNSRVVSTSAAELLAVCLALLLVPCALRAQPQPGDFGVFPTVDGVGVSLDLPNFTPKNVYIVGFELEGQVKGFEMSLSIPPELTVLNVLDYCDNCVLWDPENILRGTGACLEGSPTFRFVTVNLANFGSGPALQDGLLCVGPPESQSPALNGRPGYLQCDNDLVPLNLAQRGGPHYPDGCLIINPTHPDELPVPTAPTTFGALKAQFQNP